MGIKSFNSAVITIEINILNPEKLLNIMWSENIKILNVKRLDIATIRVSIYYDDYHLLREIIKRLNGKIRIIDKSGFLFLILSIRKKVGLVIGAGVFLCMLFYLSTYVWDIEIVTKKNIPPYQIRQQLYQLGIKPGIKKTSINVKDIEKKIEDLNSDVLWIRVRVEGSALKIVIEEKVNPPKERVSQRGNLTAKMGGQVNRVYTFSGRAKVHVGDVVNSGDVIIEGINGKDEEPYEVEPRGVVMANTFYEKSMKVKIQGTELKRTGNKEDEIYLRLLDKKIYLKKAIKNFEEYDKIEKIGILFNKVTYFEKKDVEVEMTKEEAVENSVSKLEESLYNELTREAKIVDRIIDTKSDEEGNITVNIVFVVQQNIANNEPINY